MSFPQRHSTSRVLVRSRIKEIREIVTALNDEEAAVRFGYVSTHDNPAGARTRGLTREQLKDHKEIHGQLVTPLQGRRWHMALVRTAAALSIGHTRKIANLHCA
ncbi:hypothetical protein NECAME_07056 [Necator americanus]|uniref:Uncharacterized protein n=1 Tax=Necator americanus TaxID=51031 RepID=W2TQN4_NECAM|nr:hypothetical protein NECAME_07056 [Necator americanus]ETN84108.1 hypothetical protein NECAME_07056 [Necator americanus]